MRYDWIIARNESIENLPSVYYFINDHLGVLIA